MNYKEIRAVYNEKTVRVYQAYCKEIAEQALKLGRFGNRFKRERMTWIKPSFLWMMYRSGWAEKQGQEHILAIDIKRSGFDYIIKNAVVSTYSPESGVTMEQWKEKIKSSEIRVQWDPERDIYGNPLEYRSVQLGLRGGAVNAYCDEWIENIEDITGYVQELKQKRNSGKDIVPFLPQEKIYKI